MMMGADHSAINHLELVWRDPSVVQRVQDVLPQPGKGPAAELAVDRGPLAELFGQVAPRRAGSCDPENTIQNNTMIRRFPPIRVSDATNEALEEGPLIVGYQVARQAHLPSREELESYGDRQRNPFCQHDLADVASEIGISYQQLQKHEAGRNSLTIHRMTKIANALEVDLQTILEAVTSPDDQRELSKFGPLQRLGERHRLLKAYFALPEEIRSAFLGV